MDGVLTLLTSTVTKDAYGVRVESFTGTDVFCKVESVTRAEFFGGGRNGLNPQYVFTVFYGDYSGQRTCKYDGQSYAIYRTYKPDNTDYIELYAQIEGGANGKSNATNISSGNTENTG